MSQQYDLPMNDPLGAELEPLINDSSDALLTTFAGTSEPVSPAKDGMQFYNSSGNGSLSIRHGGTYRVLFPDLSVLGGGALLRDGTQAATANISMGGFQIKDLAAGALTSDAVNKAQVDGRILSVAHQLGTINSNYESYLLVGGQAATIVSVKLVSFSATVSDATNRWTIQLINVTQAQNLLSVAYDTNTNGDFAKDVPVTLSPDQFQTLAADDVLQLQVTKNGSATDLLRLMAIVEYTSPIT